jgi:hypothetical protein
MTTTEISGTDDIINVSDITDFIDEFNDTEDEDELEQLNLLKDLLSQLKGYGGDHQWEGNWYPGHLIRDTYFVEYCEDMVKDIGDLPKDLPRYLAIDWDKTADNLRVDYSSVEFEGTTYWYR